MMKKHLKTDLDPEIIAISAVYTALKDLNQDAQNRVINYVSAKLGLNRSQTDSHNLDDSENGDDDDYQMQTPKNETDLSHKDTGQELEGISPVARKWMLRNGLSATALSSTFSLGVDEIDLVAKTVPGGKNKKEKMRSVFLLKGVAAYLGGGVARFTHEQAKETCLHYDAYDGKNFATYLKGMQSEVSGNKETGYQLSARGLASATEILKQLNQPQKPS